MLTELIPILGTGLETGALIGLIASAASTAAGAATAIVSGIASKKNADRNAVIARQQAMAEAEQHRLDTIRRMGATRAAFGSSGVDSTGSPEEVLGDDALSAGRQNSLILYGGKIDADRQKIAGRNAMFSGIGEGIAGFGKAGGTLLTGMYSYDREIARSKE